MKRQTFDHEEQRYSIRKYAVGAASVLIGIVLFMYGSTVSAEETVITNSESAVTQTVTTEEAISEVKVTDEVDSGTTEVTVPEETSTETTASIADTSDTTEVLDDTSAVHVDTSQEATLSDIDSYEEASDETATEADKTDTTTIGATETVATAPEVSESDATTEAEETSTDTTSVTGTEAEVEDADVETVVVELEALTDSVTTDTSTLATSAVTTTTNAKDIPSSGYYTYTEDTEVKNSPSASAATEFTATAGTKVYYDKTLTADGYQWISYLSYSNVRRYAAITKLVTTTTTTAESKVTGDVTIENLSSTGFDVVISNVSDSNGVVGVKVPVWSTNADQDDIIWYNAEKQSNGTYKVTVATSDHNNETGQYNVHVYYTESSGKVYGVSAQTVTVPATSQGALNIPSSGTYTFTSQVDVKNEAKMSATTQFNFNAGESIYYDKVLEADSHQWISYISYSGTRRYIPITTLTSSTESTRTGTISIANQSNGDFDVIVSNVSDSNGVAKVNIPVWSTSGDQDDIVWYEGVKQSDGTYKATVKLSDHKNDTGEYNVHLYYTENNGQLVGVAATKTTAQVEEAKRTGTISIANQINSSFDVIISDVSDTNGVTKVNIPVWSTNADQDDIVWYEGVKQSDGTYKATVQLSDHKNETGEYNIHLYYTENNGQLAGVATAKTTVVEAKVERTGTISVANQTSSSFDVIVSNVSDTNGVTKVNIPVWSTNADQDDIVWYEGVKQSDGTYKVTVQLSDHKDETGEYNIHLYYTESNGQLAGIAATKTTVTQATTTTSSLPSSGYYTYTERTAVKNSPSTSANTEFYPNAGDRVYYDKVVSADGYQWISYVSYSGTRRYAAVASVVSTITTTNTSSTSTQANVSGNVTITNETSSGFDVVISQVSATHGITSVKVPVWSTAGGQDDIIWYDATNAGNNTYAVRVNTSDHKNNTGEYNVHVYYAQTDGSLTGVAATRTTVPTSGSSSVATSTSTSNTSNTTTTGALRKYIFNSRVEVRNSASTSAPVEFYLDGGTSVNYDQTLTADGHQWISYKSYSGTRRYIVVS